MPALINFKICDNSIDCSGITVCPAGAFYWDETNQTIAVNNDLCSDCEACAQACPVDAIRVAHSEEEYIRMQAEIEQDPRTVSDLFIDRYGTQPVHPAFQISQDKFDIQILRSSKPAVVELYNPGSIQCLRFSIPIKALFPSSNIKYRKIEIRDDELLGTYGIQILPALLFFDRGSMVRKIEGYFDRSRQGELEKLISSIGEKFQ